MTLVDPVPLQNMAGEVIPACSVARPTGVTDGIVQVEKPDTDEDASVVVVGRSLVPEDQYGQGTFHPRVVVAYDPADGTPAVGETWGVKANNWKLRKNYAGFLILGGAGNGVVNALRVSDVSAGVSPWKSPCRAASTANVTLATGVEAGDTLDGVTLAAGDRVLLKDQSTASQNGIYVVASSGAPTRATDADAGGELVNAVVAVSEGTANADTIWMCTTDATITVDTTSLAWVKIYPAASSATTTILCEVTVSSNNDHTVKQLTWSGSITAVAGPVTYTQCRSTTATALPVGCVVSMDPVTDASGNYWITPVAYASVTMPGLVSEVAQTFLGDKTFQNFVHVNEANDKNKTHWQVKDGFSASPYTAIISGSGAYADTGTIVFDVFGGNDGTSTASTNPGRIAANAELRLAKLTHANASNGSMYWGRDIITATTTTVAVPMFKDSAGTAWQCAIQQGSSGRILRSDANGYWVPFGGTDPFDLLMWNQTATQWSVASGAAVSQTASTTKYYCIKVVVDGGGTAAASLEEFVPTLPPP